MSNIRNNFCPNNDDCKNVQCKWVCKTKKKCQLDSKPRCKPPTCRVVCQPHQTPICKIRTAAPNCKIQCNKINLNEDCQKHNCQTYCEPLKSWLECEKVTPKCEVVCDKLECDKEYEMPESGCEKPDCQLVCPSNNFDHNFYPSATIKGL